MANHSWPVEIKREAKRLRNAGLKLRKISDQLEVPIRTIAHWLSEERQAQSSKWPDAVVQQCIKLRERGMTYSQIKRLTGVPDPTQRGWYPEHLRALNRTRPPGSPPIAADAPDKVRKNGLIYKVGRHGKLFYLDAHDEWRRSNLAPEEVGL